MPTMRLVRRMAASELALSLAVVIASLLVAQCPAGRRLSARTDEHTEERCSPAHEHDQPPGGSRDHRRGPARGAEILTNEAIALVAKLHRAFEPRRRELLAARVARAGALDEGSEPDFLPETAHIRDDKSWKVAPPPPDLQDRRVEITGPVERKMIINALNSGAKVFMADFEDSNTPTWENTLQGQINLRDAVDGTITFTNPDGKEYALGETLATHRAPPRPAPDREARAHRRRAGLGGDLRPRALRVPQREDPGEGVGPYFYLPLESHLEARLWNDIFLVIQEEIGIPCGSIRATVLIETILAAFEMDEILYELREHSAGLNCGRWDYIFSVIKKPHPAGLRPGRPRPRHHDDPLHALLLAARDQDLPRARCARDRGHGRPDPDQERPRGQRGGAREGPRRQGARGQRRPRRHLSPTPAWCRSRWRPSTRS